jgi:hypothetical protein
MHKYVVTLKELDSFNANAALTSFEVSNHDDLLWIIEAVRTKQILDKDKSAALAVGLKLFSEVVLEKRRDPLFAPMVEPLRAFIKEFKKVS